MTEEIRVLIVDDHDIIREGLRAILVGRPGYAVVGEAANGEEAVAQVRVCRPDVILLDLTMPVMGGLEAIGEILEVNPKARILILSNLADDDMIVAAIRAGALGYLLKATPIIVLLEAVRAVYRGEPYLPPSVAAKMVHALNLQGQHQPGNLLTRRETEVLRLLANGLSNETIAQQLILSERTVATHISNILQKLSLENRTQAALYAWRAGVANL
jgi:two-component system, NarL family, response regulator LiaR